MQGEGQGWDPGCGDAVPGQGLRAGLGFRVGAAVPGQGQGWDSGCGAAVPGQGLGAAGRIQDAGMLCQDRGWGRAGIQDAGLLYQDRSSGQPAGRGGPG